MSRDSQRTQIHHSHPHLCEQFQFWSEKLPFDNIQVPREHEPLNPEDEDDVIPDQHAAFGIQRATRREPEPAWQDLDLQGLMRKGGKEYRRQKIKLSR